MRIIIFVSHWITPEVYSLVNIMRCVNVLFATGPDLRGEGLDQNPSIGSAIFQVYRSFRPAVPA